MSEIEKIPDPSFSAIVDLEKDPFDEIPHDHDKCSSHSHKHATTSQQQQKVGATVFTLLVCYVTLTLSVPNRPPYETFGNQILERC